ncbi:hypothetical protein [Rhizobium sp. Root149]|uniref:hypothetical protein n=1 Tax=Rhizobium sp. Root149 TaxID=1736473 RepID=UPI000AFCEF85|nr:hypothetical protein [Rhizobium sp. Root149]
MSKITHVSNPLTIIAIFAALAEVSGTVVLPLLQPETQRAYVWFLILFPTVLVVCFFVSFGVGQKTFTRLPTTKMSKIS